MSVDSMDQNIFDHGFIVGVYNLSKNDAELFCESLTKTNGYPHDWYYRGGRVVVMGLGPSGIDPESKHKEIGELMGEIEKRLKDIKFERDLVCSRLMEMAADIGVVEKDDSVTRGPQVILTIQQIGDAFNLMRIALSVAQKEIHRIKGK